MTNESARTYEECRFAAKAYPQMRLSPASDKSHECNLLHFFRNVPSMRAPIREHAFSDANMNRALTRTHTASMRIDCSLRSETIMVAGAALSAVAARKCPSLFDDRTGNSIRPHPMSVAADQTGDTRRQPPPILNSVNVYRLEETKLCTKSDRSVAYRHQTCDEPGPVPLWYYVAPQRSPLFRMESRASKGREE